MEFNTHETVRQLINNEVLVEKWQEFFAQLNFQSTTIVQWRITFNQGTITTYDLFREILEEWRSIRGRNGTLDTLVEVLNNIGTPFRYKVFGNTIKALALAGWREAPNIISGEVFYGVSSSVPNFTGRDQEILELTQTLTSPIQYALVCGLGGIGKTELVKKFAHNNSEENHVTWLNGDTPTSLTTSINGLAEHLHLQISLIEGWDVFKTLGKISERLRNQKWLMIIDNVDDIHEKFKSVIKFTVNIRNIFVVVTSQSRSVFGPDAALLKIDHLLPKDALNLVKNSITTETSAEEIETLCNTLHYFPLALQQAIAYIIQQQRKFGKKFGIKEYLIEFECQKLKVFDFEPSLTTEYRKTMLVNWNLTIQRLQKCSELDIQQTMNVLNILAFLSHDQITLDFLFQIHSFQFKSFDRTLFTRLSRLGSNSPVEQRKNLTKTMETLKTFSIIKIKNNYISVDRLVQELIQLSLDENSKTKILDTIITNLDLKNAQKTEVQHILNVWKHIQKQTELFLKHKSATVDIYNRLNELSLYFESLMFAEHNFQLLKKKLGENDYYTLVMERGIATSTMDTGKYEKALEHFQKILPKMQKILGKEHEATLVTANEKARTLDYLKRFSECLKIYNKILQVRIKKLGNDHEDTITTKHHIALALDNQGKYADSMQLYQEVLEWRKNKLGPNNHVTLNTRHNRATCLFRQNKYEEALIEFENILEFRVKYLGEEHADTLITKSCLARTLVELGQEERALKMFNEILPLQISTLGEHHPSTLNTKHCMAVCLFKQSKYKEALTAFENILELRVKYLGEEHADTLITKSYLARTLGELGQKERALKMINEIFTTKHNIANALDEQGKYSDSILFKNEVHNNSLRQRDLIFLRMQEDFITPIDYLGHGSFGVVFKTNSTTAYRTAKKFMFLDSKAKLDNLKREYEIIKHKCHANIVKCFGFQEYSFDEAALRLIFQINKATNKSVMKLPNEVLYMFDVLIVRSTRQGAIRTLCLEMELCGETLRKWLKAATTKEIIPNDQTRISITQDVISGLCFLHNNNILHRDLKPSNIYFSVPSTDNKYTFPIKIGDFGQAKQIEGEASCTMTVTGTRLYRAPEVDDHQRYGKQADLFSLGLIIWEIFHPTLLKNVPEAFGSLRKGDQTIIEENPNVPNLKKLIVDLTQREKSKRMKSIKDVSLI